MQSLLPMSAAQERSLYLEGIRLFNDHQFFHAHEVWEDAWRPSEGVKREFYQALIQCAVALEHYRRGNPRGVISLYGSYRRHFSHVPPTFMELDIASFMKQMEVSLRPVLERVPPAGRGEVCLDPATVPRLVLQHSSLDEVTI